MEDNEDLTMQIHPRAFQSIQAPAQVEVLQMIRVTSKRGDGLEDPVRAVIRYYDMSGKLCAEVGS